MDDLIRLQTRLLNLHPAQPSIPPPKYLADWLNPITAAMFLEVAIEMPQPR